MDQRTNGIGRNGRPDRVGLQRKPAVNATKKAVDLSKKRTAIAVCGNLGSRAGLIHERCDAEGCGDGC